MAFGMIAASLVTGAIGAYSANKASKRQAAGIQADIDFRKKQANRALVLHEPYMDAGKDYLGIYSNMMGLNGQEGSQSALDRYKNTPSYQLMQEAVGKSTTDVQGAMAANGMLGSGAYGKELMDHISPTILNDYYRYQTGIGSGVDMGRQATGAATGVMQNTAQGVGNALSRQGAAEASGIVGGNNAMQKGFQNAMSSYMWNQGRQDGAAYPLQYDPTWGNTTTGYLQ